MRGFATSSFSSEGLFHGVRGNIITVPRKVRCLLELTVFLVRLIHTYHVAPLLYPGHFLPRQFTHAVPHLAVL